MPSLPQPDVAPVRPDEAIDVAAVDAWVRGAVPELAEPAEMAELAGSQRLPRVRQFTGGASNLTYLLRYPGRDLVLRRPPAGPTAASAHDMAREFRVQQRIAPQFPLVPRVLALCQDPAVIGADFYVMDRVQGTVLRTDAPAELDAATAERLCHAAVDVLARLHAVDVDAAGLGDLDRGPGYVQRQVHGWTGRYRSARTPGVPDGEAVMEWLAETMPADAGHCLIHNDFRLDNLVLDGEDLARPVGVLDWEMATVGDPLMDLGGALAYWVQADDEETMLGLRRQPTHLPGMLTRRQLLEAYSARTGLDALATGDAAFYEVFGLFRLAVIVQQIFVRYHRGQTTDPKFAGYSAMAGYLLGRCERLIRTAG